MSLVTVLRIINSEGRGFYHDGFDKNFPDATEWFPETTGLAKFELADYMQKKHPHIVFDERQQENQNTDCMFGFSDAQQMIDWFPESVLKDVTRFGGKIMMYKLDEQYVTKYPAQCIFDISKVEFAKELNLMEFMDLVEPMLNF